MIKEIHLGVIQFKITFILIKKNHFLHAIDAILLFDIN